MAAGTVSVTFTRIGPMALGTRGRARMRPKGHAPAPHTAVARRAADIAGDAAVEHPHDQVEESGGEPDEQRNPGAAPGAGEDVPPEVVGAEPVSRGWGGAGPGGGVP